VPNYHHAIAYFSLEIGLDPSIPTYSGGLGVLAGDTIKAAADLGLPYVAVTLLYRGGYFTQTLTDGTQSEGPTAWTPEDILEEMPQRSFVPIEGRIVHVRCFRHWVVGVHGRRVPVYFLDTDLPENAPEDRAITQRLYAGDTDHRIKQEAVLAIAGRRMLRALTHDVSVSHMNEGHAFLITLEMLSEHLSRFEQSEITPEAIRYVQERCVFTTHTPVPAGHDRFSVEQVRRIVGDHPLLHRPDLMGSADVLNTTIVALSLSRYANGVARKHGEVSRGMFPEYTIDAITNGVHAATWVQPECASLFDRCVPSWRAVNADLRLAASIPDEDLLRAHRDAKTTLIAEIASRGGSDTGAPFDTERLTIGFARRATAYKQPQLLMSDLDRLRAINRDVGPIQIVYAGKAHPHDGRGKEIIHEIHEAMAALAGEIPVAFVPNYNMALCAKMIAGVDVWLNNPTPPMEASGTSGMKAALNGVPSLSSPDGWWLEGCVEGVTGWDIEGDTPAAMAHSLYAKLEAIVAVHKDPARWAAIMRACITLNGSYFTTERMLREYVERAYLD
jgi:starch phosphorylase